MGMQHHEADEGGKLFDSWQFLGKIKSHQNERDPKAMQV